MDPAQEGREKPAEDIWHSLLWPEGGRPAPAVRGQGREEGWSSDLDLENLIKEVCPEPSHRDFVAGILRELCRDEEAIRYRQDILEDLLRLPALRDALQALGPRISAIHRYHAPREKGEQLFEVTWRLGELEAYVDCIQALDGALEESAAGTRSKGITGLRARLQRITQDATYRTLRRELPELLARVRGIASATIGVNLDQDLQPFEAALLSVSAQRITGSYPTLLRKLLGEPAASESGHGIAPLHRAPSSRTEPGDAAAGPGAGHPLLVPLFRDLSHVLARVCRPIADALRRYGEMKSDFLLRLDEELAFYLGAAELFLGLRSRGLPFCKPELAPAAERTCLLRDTYSLSLALRLAGQDEGSELGDRVVRNDSLFGPEARVFILTGPNRGGKTTYMQAVGQAHVLAQAGLYVPGSRAVLSPVDAVFTHFPREERPEMDAGRLGEEARRLTAIFQRATPDSLILLNESLSNTSPRESLQLALDVVRALHVLGARAIYTTHLHELAAEAAAVRDGERAEGEIASLVSLTEEEPGPAGGGRIRRTFKIARRAPAGLSHAREIALMYGISYEQLIETLRSRGVIP
jgi:hypothetical protein